KSEGTQAPTSPSSPTSPTSPTSPGASSGPPAPPGGATTQAGTQTGSDGTPPCKQGPGDPPCPSGTPAPAEKPELPLDDEGRGARRPRFDAMAADLDLFVDGYSDGAAPRDLVLRIRARNEGGR